MIQELGICRSAWILARVTSVYKIPRRLSSPSQALNVILDYDDQDDFVAEEEKPLVEQSAQRLYGLIHARFILTSRGMAAMFEKYCKETTDTQFSSVYDTATGCDAEK